MENDILNDKKSGRKKTIFIGISVCMVMLLGVLLNLNIHAGTDTNPYQRALVLGYGDYGVTITIGPDTALGASPDYTCDGTADDVQFQQALNAFPANGGKLHVLGGQYNFTSTITRAIGNVIIEGNGYSTYFVYNGANPIFTAGGSNWVFEDIRFDAGFITTNTDTQVLRCWDGATYYAYDTNSGADNVNLPTGRTATYVVAASNSSDASKAQADLVCDGTADDVQIQAAIDALPVGGGKVSLLEGTYNTTTVISISGTSVVLAGMGDSTIIKRTSGSDITLLSVSGINCTVRDLRLHGNKNAGDAPITGDCLDISGGSFMTLQNLYIEYAPDHNIYGSNGADKTVHKWSNLICIASGHGNIVLAYVSGLVADQLVVSTAGTGHDGIYMTHCVENLITNSLIDVNDRYGIYYDACQTMSLIGNYIGGSGATGVIQSGDYNALGSHDFQIHGNIFNGNGAAGSGHYELSFVASGTLDAVSITDNNFIWWRTSWAGGTRSVGAISISGQLDNCEIKDNQVVGFTTPINIAAYTGSGLRMSNNPGATSEYWGTRTITSGTITFTPEITFSGTVNAAELELTGGGGITNPKLNDSLDANNYPLTNVGTTTLGNDRIVLGDNVALDQGQGLYWNGADTGYAIYRAAGAWVQALNINWATGLIFDAGSYTTIMRSTIFNLQTHNDALVDTTRLTITNGNTGTLTYSNLVQRGIVLDTTAGTPSATEGAVYYNGTVNCLFVYDGSAWKACWAY